MPTDKTIFQLTADTSPALTDYALSGKDPAGTPTTVYVLWSNIAKMVLGGFSALGDIVYGGASGAPTKLAGNTTTTKKYLAQTGNGSVSAAPTWSQPAISECSDYSNSAEQDMGSITWTGGSAPTSLSQAKYRWTKVGNLVFLRWRFEYGSAGASNTKYAFALPGDCPTPVDFTGQGVNEVFIAGAGMGSASRTGQAQAGRCYLYKNAGGTYDVMCEFGAISSVMGSGCIVYAC